MKPIVVSKVAAAVRYFQHLRDGIDEEDGVAMGTIFMDAVFSSTDRSKKDHRKLVVADFIEKNIMVARVVQERPFFKAMMVTMLNGIPTPPSKCLKGLEDLTKEDGAKIGKALAVVILSNVTSDAAVDGWVRTYPALLELETSELWLRGFFNTVVQKTLKNVAWGTKVRVYLGASLSIGDMASDLFMVGEYMGEAETAGFAHAILGMVGLSMLIQLLVAFLQKSRAKHKSEQVRELLLVLSGLKPAADAHRVSSGKEQQEHEMFDPMQDMIAGKVIELVCESIPGATLQLYVILSSNTLPRKAAFMSLALSMMTTSFSATTIAYDMDTSPEKRKYFPAFYGVIPDQGRMSVLMVMVLMSFCQVAARALSLSLLFCMSTGSGTAVAWLSTEMAVYLLVKVVRQDLPVPWRIGGLPSAVRIIIALVYRSVVKIFVDATGNLHFRHPFELGGAY